MRRLRKPNPQYRLLHPNSNRIQQSFRVHSYENYNYNYCHNNSNMVESGSSVRKEPGHSLDSAFRLEGENDQETKLVINSIREVISCCACFTSDSLMKECANGHLICYNCFLTLRQDDRPQCPTCRTNLYSDSKQALIAQKVLSELPDFCQYCGQKMLHKSLVNHRLNKCVKRRVACALSPFGCDWIGMAEHYREHYDSNCRMRKFFNENSIEDNLNLLLNRFKLIEQSMRETFHCFSTALTHLESNELQSNFINLTQIPHDNNDDNNNDNDGIINNNNNSGGGGVNKIDNVILFRSDHFHMNQSRWSLEIRIKYENSINSMTVPSSTSTNPPVEINTDPIIEADVDPDADVDLDHNPTAKRRKYDRTDSAPLGTLNEAGNGPHEKTESHWNGEINYRLIKESTPNVGRKSFSFTVIQLVVPEVGVIIYAKPQIHLHRFNLRGEHTPYYKLNPLRWKHLNNLSELLNYKLIQSQVIIARKLSDENIDN